MNGNGIKSTTGRSMTAGGAFATIALLSVSLMSAGAGPAAAQGASTGTASPQRASQNARSFGTRIPGNMQPVVTRIAEMWVAANHRANDSSLSSGARESYRNAATALRQALASAHLRPTGNGGGRYDADVTISSGQLLSDISALRSAAANMSGPRAGDLVQVASLYATGAKEFFTGTVRDALLSSGGSRNAIAATTGGTLRVSNTSVPYVDPVADGPKMPPAAGLGGADAGFGTFGFSQDPAFWGPSVVYGGNDGGTVVVGPGGVNAIPGTGSGPVDNGPTVVVGPPPVQ